MPRGALIVESRPTSPDRIDEFNKWYEDVHMPEVLALDGFVSARRFRPLDGDGPMVAVYDIDADDLNAAARRLLDAGRDGTFTMSDSMQFDPPPKMRFFELAEEQGT